MVQLWIFSFPFLFVNMEQKKPLPMPQVLRFVYVLSTATCGAMVYAVRTMQWAIFFLYLLLPAVLEHLYKKASMDMQKIRWLHLHATLADVICALSMLRLSGVLSYKGLSKVIAGILKNFRYQKRNTRHLWQYFLTVSQESQDSLCIYTE